MTTQAAACQKCGRSVDAGAQFCAHCGSNVSAAQGSAATRMISPTADLHDVLLERLRDVTLGEYEILTELGRGGMATVYLGHDLQLDRRVAIKVMLPELLEGEGMTERFKLEARTAAQLSHPHIIPIYAVRDQDDLLFFVMKFVEGRPLDSIVAEVGKLPIPMAQLIISKVGEALGYAHRRGVVHRDIKPANLMIDVEGMPVVTDFGIAKVADKRGLTMTGATIGTPTYMSPEQCAAGAITGASDQYSLGVVAYELLSGRPTFQGDSIVSLLYKHCHEPPPPFMDQRPDCPPELHAAVMKMLAKKPEDRFPSLEAAVQAVGSVSLSYDDPNRSKLIDLAKHGGNLNILARVSTPRSPTPMRSKVSSKRTGHAPVGTVVATPSQVTPAAPPARSSSRALMGGLIALVAVVGIGVGVWRPWSRTAEPAATPPVGTSTATVASVSVQPSTGIVDLNSTSQLTAVARDPNGLTVNTEISWTSENPDIATVSSTGLVTAVSAGSARIRAAVGAVQSWAQLTVTGAAAAPTTPATPGAVMTRIRIEGAPASLGVGGSAQLRATGVDARGGAAGDRSPVWSSSDPPLATVSPRGLVTALAPGNVTLTARSGNISESVSLQITAARAASVAVSSPPGPLAVGASTRLNASVRGDDGRPVGSVVSWRSADPRVATVSDGLVTAVGAGSTIITASADGREATTAVTVSAPQVAQVPTPVPAPDNPPRPAPAPNAAEARDAISAVIQAYARAIESRQIAEVRQVYSGMSAAQETRLSNFLSSADSLNVTFRVGSVDVQGETATASVSGQYDFISPENRRATRLPQSFQATLDLTPNGWRLRSIR